MVYGLWFMVYGLWGTANSLRSVYNNCYSHWYVINTFVTVLYGIFGSIVPLSASIFTVFFEKRFPSPEACV
jgi:hypothetical protein